MRITDVEAIVLDTGKNYSDPTEAVEAHGVPGIKAAAAGIGLRPGLPRLPLAPMARAAAAELGKLAKAARTA